MVSFKYVEQYNVVFSASIAVSFMGRIINREQIGFSQT